MSDSKSKWSPRGLEHWVAIAEQRGKPFGYFKPRPAKKIIHHRMRRSVAREIAGEVSEVLS